MSMDRLIEGIVEKQNPTVVGLDPKLSFIPPFILEEAFSVKGDGFAGAAEAIYRYNCGIIDAIADIVPAVKPQAAYYEMYGWQGVKALADTVAYAKERGLFVIIDGKRNDIGSTMEAYVRAQLGKTSIKGQDCAAFDGDAMTVNGYLGSDSVDQLIQVCREEDKGFFILLKTSNPSSGELQDLVLENGDTVYQTMGKMTQTWGKELPGKYGYSGAGAVVGATYPKQLESLRTAFPETFFLIPGYGAQGGKASDITAAFDENGLGGIVNSSRWVLTAWQRDACCEEDFGQAARRETEHMREALLKEIGTIEKP